MFTNTVPLASKPTGPHSGLIFVTSDAMATRSSRIGTPAVYTDHVFVFITGKRLFHGDTPKLRHREICQSWGTTFNHPNPLRLPSSYQTVRPARHAVAMVDISPQALSRWLSAGICSPSRPTTPHGPKDVCALFISILSALDDAPRFIRDLEFSASALALSSKVVVIEDGPCAINQQLKVMLHVVRPLLFQTSCSLQLHLLFSADLRACSFVCVHPQFPDRDIFFSIFGLFFHSARTSSTETPRRVRSFLSDSVSFFSSYLALPGQRTHLLERYLHGCCVLNQPYTHGLPPRSTPTRYSLVLEDVPHEKDDCTSEMRRLLLQHNDAFANGNKPIAVKHYRGWFSNLGSAWVADHPVQSLVAMHPIDGCGTCLFSSGLHQFVTSPSNTSCPLCA